MQTRNSLLAVSLAAVVLVSSAPVRPSGGSTTGGQDQTASEKTPLGRSPDQVLERLQDEDDERAFARELGRRSLEGNCLMCHSSEMIVTQRLTPEQWAAEVEKMIGWGAPVPDEEKETLIAYLADAFAVEGDEPTFDRMTLAEARSGRIPEPDADALPPGDPARGLVLFTDHCATCHGNDGLGGDLGMSLIAHPTLLRPADYAAILKDGRHRMPGFRLVLSNREVADTLAWLRERSESGEAQAAR